jgi:hypothetical protein
MARSDRMDRLVPDRLALWMITQLTRAGARKLTGPFSSLRSYVERLKNPPPHEAIELRKLLYGKTPDDQKGAGQVREEKADP